MDLVRLLHEIDGQLGLAVHRGEGKNPQWISEADALIGRIRAAIPEVEKLLARAEPDYLDPADLRIETIETDDFVVGITHTPTGISASSDPNKSMIRAREQALTRLREALRG